MCSNTLCGSSVEPNSPFKVKRSSVSEPVVVISSSQSLAACLNPAPDVSSLISVSVAPKP
jgi:hypothetical protein